MIVLGQVRVYHVLQLRMCPFVEAQIAKSDNRVKVVVKPIKDQVTHVEQVGWEDRWGGCRGKRDRIGIGVVVVYGGGGVRSNECS